MHSSRDLRTQRSNVAVVISDVGPKSAIRQDLKKDPNDYSRATNGEGHLSPSKQRTC